MSATDNEVDMLAAAFAAMSNEARIIAAPALGLVYEPNEERPGRYRLRLATAEERAAVVKA